MIKERYFKLFHIFVLVSLNHAECIQCAKEKKTAVDSEKFAWIAFIVPNRKISQNP